MDTIEQHLNAAADHLYGLGVASEDLDNDVHDRKSREAAEINNGGLARQLAHLLAGASAGECERVVEQILLACDVDPRLAAVRLV